MRETSPPSPAVVVGIDGSHSAVDASLWAVDEAVKRDLPLRLVYAIEPAEGAAADNRSVTHAFTTAEAAVRHAAMAIESLDQPVKIEVEIVQGRPVAALLAASHSAAMVCLGALGFNRASGKQVGSTVSALLARAHCPIAVIRQSGRPMDHPGWVVTEFDKSADSTTVLDHAVSEARLRNAPLRVLTSWRPGFNDIHDTHASAEGSRQAKATLERSLTRYRLRYPEVEIKAVAVTGSPMNYLARHAESIQLLVLGHQPSDELSEFTGPGACAALSGLNCSVLISERHSAL